jgi:hypothetical protein
MAHAEASMTMLVDYAPIAVLSIDLKRRSCGNLGKEYCACHQSAAGRPFMQAIVPGNCWPLGA